MRRTSFIVAVGVLAVLIFGCSRPEAQKECRKPAARWVAESAGDAALSRGYSKSEPSACEAPSDGGWSSGADREAPATEVAAVYPTSPPASAPAESPRADFASEPVVRARPPARRNRHIQSGTLTAGSFDDHERFEDYKEFLSEALQNDTAEVLPRLEIGRRVMIRVSNAAGSPIGDARVVVRPADSQRRDAGPALLDVTTAGDGRAMFLTGRHRSGSRRFRITVEPPRGSQTVTRVMHVDEAPWTITLPKATAELPARLDLALVVDTTGSMSDELEYLKVEIDSIAAAIHRMFPNVDQRYALVLYRDEGDAYVTRTFGFTGALSEFRTQLASQSASGGGDYPEAVHVALEQAGKLDWRDRGTARVMFLVGDAPPHDCYGKQTLEAVDVLAHKGVRVFPVAASGVKLKAEFVMRATSFLTLGQYLFLTDHSGVGNPHAQPHVPDYQVEHLNRLMIRMIASELAGKRLGAAEVIAIENGRRRVTVPVGIEPQQQRQTSTTPPRRTRKLSAWWSPAWAILGIAVLFVCVVDAVDKRRE